MLRSLTIRGYSILISFKRVFVTVPYEKATRGTKRKTTKEARILARVLLSDQSPAKKVRI
jgi:hypothetical protein